MKSSASIKNKIQGMSDKEASNVTQRAARALKREFAKKSNHGDSEAEAMQAKINDALNIIKNPEERKKYDESLQSGENAGTEIFRIQKCAPPFFWDRNARYRAIEHLMRQEKVI